MELVEDCKSLEAIGKPRSLQLLDLAYDPSTFKFSQIIRYLQDQYSFHQDVEVEMCDPSTSPLPVDPKLAYDIHTGRYMRRFKTQGSTIVGHNAHGVVKLPYPPRVPSKVSNNTPVTGDNQLPKHDPKIETVPTVDNEAKKTQAELKSSHNLLRKQVWRLPSHVNALRGKKYKQPLKLPPITISKLMSSV